MASNLAPAELFKHDSRVDKFLEKYKARSPFELLDGRHVKFKYQQTIAKLIREKDIAAVKTILLITSDGKSVSLSQLKKTAEFGGKNGKKSTSTLHYGHLGERTLSEYTRTAFRDISPEFASGHLVTHTKEPSDAVAVNDMNTAITNMLTNPLGITLVAYGYHFHNVIGCIPVTLGEPKADIVLVSINEKTKQLFPSAYISYKMGTSAKHFQNYSGLSEKSASYIFHHPDTKKFYEHLAKLSDASTHPPDAFQIITDTRIIQLSVWGKDFGQAFGVNNCHFLAQGKVTISGTTLTYSHVQKNGDMTFDKNYQPVFGARYTANRNNKGPDGIHVDNYRLGIFPRAYRTEWLQTPDANT